MKRVEPDSGLIEQWVDAHSTRLYRAAALFTSEAEAADLCQEVFLIAARKQHSFDARSTAYTWLYGILRNLVRDRRKKQNRRTLRLVEDPPQNPVARQDPETKLSAAEDRDRVRTAVGALAEGQRDVVALFYLEELAVAEVADRLELPIGTVKSRLFQARATLKRALKGGR